MKLLVVSHTAHYRVGGSDGGEIVGWAPTVRELDHLAGLFTELVHLAPLHQLPPSADAPRSSRPYRAGNVRLHPLKPSGGERLRDKLGILAGAPAFVAALRREVERADAVHVRAPANVALLALLARPLLPARPWWVKYAGNWRPDGETARREALSYRLQRALLRQGRGWAVTVNGRFPDDPPHVRAFLNPSLDRGDLDRAANVAAAKVLDAPARLLFVGRLDEAKGAGRALELAARLGAEIEIAGDGPERAALETTARRLGARASFHGWLPRPRLDELYRRAHLMALPSLASEGWPKVLSEAMAWGVVPLASDISAIPGILGELGVGAAVPARDLGAQVAAAERLLADFEKQSRRAVDAAPHFSYDAYLAAVRSLFAERFGLRLAD